MLTSRYEYATQANVRKSFGNKFAEKLFLSSEIGWQEPLDSGYGVHLVFIESIVSAKTPEPGAIRASLEAEWIRRKQNESNAALYQALREKYAVVIGESS